MNLKSFCFASFVFGSYEKYIPFYIYSISKSYPEAFVKIFTEDDLSENVKKSLDFLMKSGFENFQILDPKLPNDYYSEFNFGNGKNQTGKLARWLLNYSYFEEFSYCYIGDVDFIHLPEKIHIVDFHKKNMEKFGLPFSNMVRKDKSGTPIRRMAGWHFFEPKNYYEKVEPIINKLKNNREYRYGYLKKLERNEHFLYELTKEAFNFDDHELSKMYRPWHGLHIGISRGNENIDAMTIQNNTSLSLNETKQLLTNFAKDSVFIKLQNMIFVIELDVIFQELGVERPLKWKWWRLRYKRKKKTKLLIRKIKSMLK